MGRRLPFPKGRGTQGNFFLLMGEMREKVSVQGGKEALDWGPCDNSPFSSPATLSTFIKPEAWTAGPSSVDFL